MKDSEFTPDGRFYGIGSRPQKCFKDVGEYRHTGQWHGRFPRRFLPKGKFHTNEDGNLAHVDTLDTDVDKYALPEEDQSVHHTLHDRNVRLPRPGERRR